MPKAHVCFVLGVLTSALVVTVPLPAAASPQDRGESRHSAARDDYLAEQGGMQAARRDVTHRAHGVRYLQSGDYIAAAEQFRIAARYGDKISQAAYAELLWDGRGLAQDRPLAYAWMDLAAERGSPALLARREGYWEALDAQERARAVEVGQAVYDEYGDAVAVQRQERLMARDRRRATGSRLGSTGSPLKVSQVSEITGNPGNIEAILQGAPGVDGGLYYADRYWDPARHRERQERQLERLRQPDVRVGDLEPDASPVVPRRPVQDDDDGPA